MRPIGRAVSHPSARAGRVSGLLGRARAPEAVPERPAAGGASKRDPARTILAVVLVVAVVAALIYVKVYLGLSVVVVDGRSMLPTLQTGDLVFVLRHHGAIRVGDVVVYRYTGFFYGYYLKGALIIHRVVYIYSHNGVECYVTKGDNNPVVDPGYPQLCGSAEFNGTVVSGVPASDIVGVVAGGSEPIAIPYLGGLSLAFRPVEGPT